MKELLSTKTFWLGLSEIAFGAYLLATGETDMGLAAIAHGLGLITLRDAVRKV